MRFVVQNKFIPLTLVALSLSFASVSSAAVQECAMRKSAYDKASLDYTRADGQFTRLQQQVDSKAEQAAYKRSILEGNVEQAAANVKAAETSAIGQGVRCVLAPRGGCAGPTVNSIMIKISRAKALLKTQQGRLDAFNRAYNQQMTRLSQRVTQQDTLVKTKKATLDQKEVAYNTCMAAA
jgi:flagellar biosynthesis chaperone FliJ